MNSAHRWRRIAIVLAVALVAAAGCQRVERKVLGRAEKPPAPTLALAWSDAPAIWSIKAGEQVFRVAVTNRGAAPVWMTIKPFENACFVCKGFGPWTTDWDVRGQVPVGGGTRDFAVPFVPRGVCPAADYYLFVETRTSSTQPAPDGEFSTAQDDHAGSKKLRVEVVE